MGIRLWSEILPQHRVTPELLASLNDRRAALGERYWRQFDDYRLLGGGPQAYDQCEAVLKALHVHWDSQWVPANPDRRFTTEGYVKLYLRCPEWTKNGHALCRRHGGPKRETRNMVTITFGVRMSDLVWAGTPSADTPR